MSRKLFRIISNLTFISAIGLSIYLLVKRIVTVRSLPPGTCPVNENPMLYYIAIALLLLSIILSFFDKKE